MKKSIKLLYCDIAPLEGRKEITSWQAVPANQVLTWAGTCCSVVGELIDKPFNSERTLHLQGSIYLQNDSTPTVGWLEIESIIGQPVPTIADLYLVGTRPLPQANITCISRHPTQNEYLVAATSDSYLLLLDARLQANLNVLARIKLTSPLVSLVCCGKRLLGLESPSTHSVQIIDIDTSHGPLPSFLPGVRIYLPQAFIALAENDSTSAWGLTAAGNLCHLPLPGSQHLSLPDPQIDRRTIRQTGQLRRPQAPMGRLMCCLKGTYRAIKKARPFWRVLSAGKGAILGLAYDGQHFWSSHQDCQNIAPRTLLLYNSDGSLLKSFNAPQEVSLSSLNYIHNNLLVLDLEHQQLHQFHLADTMQPVAWLPLTNHHPGYLPAGTSITAGIHDLCLLYVGAEGSSAIHRYDIDKLAPLVGYLTPAGVVNDFFMDGFLLLAQYSPLLNGRSFGMDLEGQPSRQEDWLALFDEYFHPQANLQALENCTTELNHQLHVGKTRQVKVVLSIPTPDPRCINWDNDGFSLALDCHRVEVTEWAISELLDRWEKANFQHLTLAGFYYMTEQGSWNDQVLHMFPQLCHKYGLCSFAIPGITSSWITEFNRAGFDCVALQSSHAFWQPPNRPRYYNLKCAGRIAREFGMGMEIELPYDVLAPEGREKLSDYLEMAYIQGWAGAFKAYFQSYNLIKTLAESEIPECRKLYDDLYQISRVSRQPKSELTYISRNKLVIDCRAKWATDRDQVYLRLNIEGHQGIFKLTSLSEE